MKRPSFEGNPYDVSFEVYEYLEDFLAHKGKVKTREECLDIFDQLPEGIVRVQTLALCRATYAPGPYSVKEFMSIHPETRGKRRVPYTAEQLQRQALVAERDQLMNQAKAKWAAALADLDIAQHRRGLSANGARTGQQEREIAHLQAVADELRETYLLYARNARTAAIDKAMKVGKNRSSDQYPSLGRLVSDG